MPNRYSPTLRLLASLILFWSTSSALAEDNLAIEFKSTLDAIVAAAATPDGSSILAEHIDYAAVTRGVIGRHRELLNQEQTSAFQRVFEQSMADLLRSATEAAGKFTSDITKTRISDKNPNRAQAVADIRMENGQVLQIVASMARDDSGWKVRNLIFDGVNLGLTYRNQFSQLMRETENDADSAIARWTELTNKHENK